MHAFFYTAEQTPDHINEWIDRVVREYAHPVRSLAILIHIVKIMIEHAEKKGKSAQQEAAAIQAQQGRATTCVQQGDDDEHTPA